MKKLYMKKEIYKVKSLPIDPNKMDQPTTAAEFQLRGMAFYARKQHIAAEDDLKKAILLDANNIDSWYSLGMVLKATDRKKEAVEAFNQVLNMVGAKVESTNTKNDMLRRLALGHINSMTQGDWNLEKEIWQRIA
jgi:tetratricopeptide (TPR) repeat protein